MDERGGEMLYLISFLTWRAGGGGGGGKIGCEFLILICVCWEGGGG